jgi:intraflagellar transport protein 172
LGGEAAVKLLSKFGLLDAAIDFATENTAFDFAFELSKYADKYRLSDIYYKHAMFLEDEGKFKEAENSFILAGKPKEAILMYIHNEDWDSARVVAETYDPSSVADVLVGQAKVSFEQKDYAKCETLLLRAQCPEFALKLYKEANMWQDALRFATEYLPARTSEIHKEYSLYINAKGDTGRDEILSTAKMLEQQKEYSKAIDLYLKLGTSQIANLDQLEAVWEKAVELCMKFVPERGQEVVSSVCKRLVSIERYQTAAEFYHGVELFKEAIDTYILANNWDRARELLQYAPNYADYVESAYINYLKQRGAIDALVDVDVTAGLDLYAQRGEWDKCLDKANNQVRVFDPSMKTTA